MVILITGASGFIGSRLARALADAGHDIVRAQRSAGGGPGRLLQVDFARDLAPEDWLPRLAGVDAVVNAVGILRERDAGEFERLHSAAPRALFAACAQRGVRLVVQISALGADEHATSAYHLSKRAADDFLAALSIPAVIVQPSLVYGPGGASARLFDLLASLPVVPLPGPGLQQVQPIHVDDLVAAIAAIVDDRSARSNRAVRVPLVGPQPLSLRDFLARLRRSLGLPAARFWPVPMAWVRGAAALGSLIPGALLDRDTLGMLVRGNVADPAATRQWLRREPRPVDAFVAPGQQRNARRNAQLDWLLPLLRTSVALVWIVTGIVSLGLYPVQESYALLARVGVRGALAPVFLYGAAVLDVVLGVAVLVSARRRSWWLAQVAVILGYTAIITWKLPEFWLHPYGPLLKNVPMLAAIALLYSLEERR